MIAQENTILINRLSEKNYLFKCI